MLYTLKLFSSAPIILYSHRNTEEKKIYKIWIFPSMVKRIPLQHLNPHFYIIKSVLLSPLIHHFYAPNTNWVHVFYFLNIIDRWCPNAYVHYKQTLFLPISDTQEYPEVFVRTREIGPRTMKNGLVLNITILLYDVLWNILFQELIFFFQLQSWCHNLVQSPIKTSWLHNIPHILHYVYTYTCKSIHR